jgi:hypothetical protein
MTRFGFAATALALGAALTFGSAIVPGAVEKASAAMSKEERAAARAATKAKQEDCKAQAKAQNLHLLKRSRFIRGCMRKS